MWNKWTASHLIHNKNISDLNAHFISIEYRDRAKKIFSFMVAFQFSQSLITNNNLFMQCHQIIRKQEKHDTESYILTERCFVNISCKWQMMPIMTTLSVIKHMSHFDLVHNAMIAANHPPFITNVWSIRTTGPI